MKRRIGGERSHAIAGVFVFLLLGVFAVFSTMLVLFGAQAYRATTQRTEMHGDSRTLYAYVLNTIRGDDAQGIVRMRRESDVDMLAILYDFDGETYEKRVYCYDGYLRELLSSAQNEFDPEAGEAICPAQSLRATMTGATLTVELTDAQGQLRTIQTVLRTMT